jgi:hypothetical protein
MLPAATDTPVDVNAAFPAFGNPGGPPLLGGVFAGEGYLHVLNSKGWSVSQFFGGVMSVSIGEYVSYECLDDCEWWVERSGTGGEGGVGKPF